MQAGSPKCKVKSVRPETTLPDWGLRRGGPIGSWLRRTGTGLIPVLFWLGMAATACALDYKLEGEMLTWGTAYRPDTEPDPDGYVEVLIAPRLTLLLEDVWLVHAKGQLRLDTESHATGVMDSLVERGERYALALAECYLEFSRGHWRSRLGKQLLDWSVTDGLSPTDTLNARDWTDIVEWERVGGPAYVLRYGGDAYLEAVLCAFTPSKLPARRWQPPSLRGFTLEEQDLGAAGEPQAALRGGALWHGFEVGGAVFQGRSYAPVLRLDSGSSSGIHLKPVYRQETVLSAFLTGELYRGVIVRADLGYFNQQQDDDFIQYVAGAERQWNGLVGPRDTFSLLVQYTNEIETQDVLPRAFHALDFRRAFNNSIWLNLRYAFQEEGGWSVRLRSIYNLSHHDGYVEPSVVWSRRKWEATLGLGVFAGSANTFWGGFNDQDRLFARLSYFF